MLEFLFDLVADFFLFSRWRNDDGEVYVRWYVLGGLLALAALAAIGFGIIYLLGMH